MNRSLRPGDEAGLRAELVRGSVGSLVFKVVQRLLLLATAVLLARLLGAGGYGVYAYALSLVTLLAVPAKLGLPTLLVREVATHQLSGSWGLVRGVIRRTNQAVTVLSLSLAALVGAGAWLMGGRLAPEHLATLRWAILLIPVVALGNLRGAALQGLRLVVQGQLPERLVRPGLFVLALLLAVGVGADMSPSSAMALHVGAAVIAFLVGSWLLRRALPLEIRTASPAFADRLWLASTPPLALLAGAQVIHKQTDILMLGVFAGAEDIGVYRVVVTGSLLVGFVLQGLTTVLAPYAARFHAAGDTEHLQRMVSWSVRLTFAAALPIAAVLVFFGEPVLGFVFGSDFVGGYRALAVLSLGQLLSIGAGPSSLLLNMSGHERDTARSFAYSTVANVVLNALLIPPFGIMGAAVATASTFVAWKFFLWWRVRQRIGVDCSVLHRSGASS